MIKNKDRDFFIQNPIIYLLLIIVPLALYFKSLWFDFSPLDEQWMILKNTHNLEKWHSVAKSFSLPTAGMYYRPLFNILLIINYHIGELNPFVYHFSSVLLHITCVVLLYRLLLNFNVTQSTSFWLSLLFAIHPVLLHAIVWIPGSNDLILCAVSLASLLFLQNYIKGKKLIFLFLNMFFFAAGLLTKENALVLPVVYIAVYLMQTTISRKELAALTICWFIISVTWLIIRNEVVEASIPKGSDLLQTGKHFIMGLLVFSGKVIYPVQQSVFPTLKNTSVIPGIITLGIFIICYFKPGVKNKRLALTGILLFFILLALPVWFGATNSSGEHYEHRAYTSMIGLFLFVSQINIKPGKTVTVIFTCICMIFIVKTFTRMAIYKDEMSYTDAGINESPDYYLFHVQKADLLFKKGEYENAIICYTKAIALRPEFIDIYNNRGHIYATIKKYEEAINDFSRSISISNNEDAYLNRCICYSNINDIDNAMKDLLILRKNYPGSVPPAVDRNITKRWLAAALSKINTQLAATPENAELYIQRAKIYAGTQERDKALSDIQKACALQPQNNLYQTYLKQLNH